MNKNWKRFFGDFSYQPPAWLKSFLMILGASSVGRGVSRFFSLRKTNPKKFYQRSGGSVVLLAVLVTGSYFGYQWYKSRPQPRLVTFQINAPGVTNVETLVVDPLVIKFTQSVARLDDLNKVLLNQIKLKPEVAGSWHWENDQTLKFEPDLKSKADWAIGTTYNFEFKKGLVADHIRLEKLDGEFTTLPLKSTVSNQEFYIDPKDPKIKRGLFTIYL